MHMFHHVVQLRYCAVVTQINEIKEKISIVFQSFLG